MKPTHAGRLRWALLIAMALIVFALWQSGLLAGLTLDNLQARKDEFFLINLLAGLTTLKTRTFYAVSQLGMLPGTVAYVYAGTRLAEIRSLGDVASPGLLGAFALLAVLPFLMPGVSRLIAVRRIYSKFSRLADFDYNLIVIGAGSGGLVSSHIAAAVKAIHVATGHDATHVEPTATGGRLICQVDGREVAFEFDRLLPALGRQANMEGFGLAELGVQPSERGTIAADGLMRTNFPNILVCGDVTGPTNSPTSPRTRPGTPRSTPCLRRSGASLSTIGSSRGRHSPGRRSLASVCPRTKDRSKASKWK